MKPPGHKHSYCCLAATYIFSSVPRVLNVTNKQVTAAIMADNRERKDRSSFKYSESYKVKYNFYNYLKAKQSGSPCQLKRVYEKTKIVNE